MRIAQLANLYHPVPPVEYGGTQRVIAQITAFQAALFGHEVTLYAAAESEIIGFTQKIAQNLGLQSTVDEQGSSISILNKDGRTGHVFLKSGGIQSIGYDNDEREKKFKALFDLLLEDEKSKPYDVIHNHNHWFMQNGIIQEGLSFKTLTHQHIPLLTDFYKASLYPLVGISDNQARILRNEYNANVQGVLYNSLDLKAYSGTKEHAGYLAWIGRVTEEKGPGRAIHIAREAGLPLIMAGRLTPEGYPGDGYFDKEIKPSLHIKDPSFLDRIGGQSPTEIREELASLSAKHGTPCPIIFCGEANERQKQALFGNAAVTLFPISAPEAFGLVMIESMACGTPVVGYSRFGNVDCISVSEVIHEGVTGFSLSCRGDKNDIKESAMAVKSAMRLDRQHVREEFESRWSSEKNAYQMDCIYQDFVKNRSPVVRT